MHNKLPNIYYFINEFDPNHISKIDSNISLIYRNYKKKIDENLIKKIKYFCKKKKIKFLLSNNFKLAIRLDLDGVYLPSFNKDFNHLAYSTFLNFAVVGSAHNLREIRIKELQQIQNIFISSVFKKNKNYLGLNKFKILSKYTEKKVVALGGISKKNIKQIKLTNASSIAGISYFEQKKGP